MDWIGPAVGGAASGFIAGFGANYALVNSLIRSALNAFRLELSKGEEGFVTRRELNLWLHQQVADEQRRLEELEGLHPRRAKTS